ncbi:MAG: sulfatase-like hydrolase/transferase [Vicinamibacterales bacterium]
MAPDTRAGTRPGARPRVPADWLAIVGCAAVVATLLDAALLHLRRSYFTGGFLSADHVAGAGETLAFFAGSLLADAAVAAPLAAITFWVFGRAGSARIVGWLATLVVVLVPLGVADFLDYQLADYLGDAFDLGLLYDLTGRSPREMLAVSSQHLAAVGGLILGVIAVVTSGIWLVRRLSGPGATPLAQASLPVMLGATLVLLIPATVVTTMLRGGSDALDNGLRRKPSGRALGWLVATGTDLDFDGYGLLGRPDDPDLFDARVRPYALDVPGNGVDEDGIGGDLPLSRAAYAEPAAPSGEWQQRPDVLLVVLESVRADAVGATLNGRPVTPVLDALAARGMRADRVYSHNGYTIQSRYHLFSGSLAGVRGPETLIDDFDRHGYQTAYFSAQDESYGGAEHAIGFDRADVAYDARAEPDKRFSTFSTAGSLALPNEVILAQVGAFLAERPADRPLFLHVNFQDTHYPYHHEGLAPLLGGTVLEEGDIGPARAAELRGMYLNAVANVDRAIGRLLEMTTAAVGREPAVIVLADHGESLFDEGFLGHGYALNDAQTRIPFVAANLPLEIAEPFGQAGLRDALDAALKRPALDDVRPRVVPAPGTRVFQYLGVIDRPAQIAFQETGGRIVVDLRERRALVDGTTWQRLDDLDGAARARALDLVHTWEAMMLARRESLLDE